MFHKLKQRIVAFNVVFVVEEFVPIRLSRITTIVDEIVVVV